MEERKLLRLDLQTFAEETGGEQTTPAEAENKPGEKDDKLPGVKKVEMTQEEFDLTLQKRIERVHKKYADYEEKAKRLAELEKAEEERKKAEMSEIERLAAEKEEAAKKAEEAAEQAKKAQEAANKRIVDTEIKSIARALNANDLNDVLALLDKSVIEVDEAGNVKGAEEAVKALKETKPWMFKPAIGADASGGSNPQKNPSINEISAKEKELAEAKEKALKDSRFMGAVTRIYNELVALKQK
ncbi:phage scaffolding protein [Niallia circulans]|uniref:phage scaffolding protein n=1 Tax=Niallia circulans TaxID=1397 RepID=UPI00155FB0E3|nr:phage scaffolding protein [Niallia circulans]NRG30706.1 phage scaffolding protein [Niallia circulans]